MKYLKVRNKIFPNVTNAYGNYVEFRIGGVDWYFNPRQVSYTPYLLPQEEHIQMVIENREFLVNLIGDLIFISNSKEGSWWTE